MVQRNTEIIKINGTDLISESIEKINTNFESLAEVTSIDRQKWQILMDETKREIDRLKESNNKKEIVISGLIRDLNDKVDNVPTIDNIQQQVNNAIKNADRELSAVISTLAGQYVNNTLGDYAKDADLEKIQTSFESFSADAKNNIATASITAANSKFYTRYKTNDTNKEQQYLVYIDDNKNKEGTSDYKDIYDYYEKNKVTIDQYNKGYGDSVVAQKLLSECEKKFKTTSTEMATINETVADGFSSVSIIAKVKDAMGAKNTGNNAKDITATIFATASEAGSGITLNADNILINSGRTLNVQSGGNINIEGGGKFQVKSGNFSIDEKGTVTVKGAIEAKSLKITGSDGSMVDISDEAKLANFVKGHQDDKWLKDALNGGTTIDGGLVLSNAILTKDSDDNITAGMIGSNNSGNDIRFFAGPQDILSPITKQKLIRVKDTINKDSLSQIFVKYPNLDRILISSYDGKLWNKDTYVYNDSKNEFQYYNTFEYNGSTYYMWKCVGSDNIAILTEERDYTKNNLKHNNNDFYSTPKIITYFKDDVEYIGGNNDANLTYIVDASNDSIYVDQFYIVCAWVLDSNSVGVSLYDYHNRTEENLDTHSVIYIKSENVNIGDTLEMQTSSTETSSYRVIDVSPSDPIEQSPFRVYEDGKFEATKGKFGCLEIGVEEYSDSKTSTLEGTIYEDHYYLSPDEISKLEPNQYYTHYIKMSPEIFQIDAHRGDEEYESVRILPLGDVDRWSSDGLVEIYARSDEAVAINVWEGIIQSNHFRSEKEIKTSTSDKYNYPVETVMSNLSGLNIAFIVSDKTQFKFEFKKEDSDYEGNVYYKLYIYLNGMKILGQHSDYFERGLTAAQTNSISVDKNISYSDGIWKYKNTDGGYQNIVGCYTTSFDKALQPSTLFITLGNTSSNGSIYLGNIKIVG